MAIKKLRIWTCIGIFVDIYFRGGPILKYFTDINFHGSRTPEFFAGQTFADLTKICEIRESFCPRNFVRLKYPNLFESVRLLSESRQRWRSNPCFHLDPTAIL